MARDGIAGYFLHPAGHLFSDPAAIHFHARKKLLMVSESFKMSGGTKMVDNRSIRPTELPAQPGLVRLMCDGIPGGIFRCLPDPVWTILEVSRGF